VTDSMSRPGDGSPDSDGLTARGRASTMGLVRAMEQPVEPAFRAPPDHSDGALVAAVAGGDRGALARLYDRYAPALLAVGQRLLGSRREAEDLVHDVFLEAWRQSAGYDPARGTVRAWLFVRLRSRALDRHRAASGAPVSIESAPGFEERMVTGDDPTLAPDRAAVRRALELLPGEQRAVLELGYFEGLSSSEIARRTGAPIGTVKSRVATALATLRAGLDPDSVRGGAR
jgi:RNA polymerase sigma-70 factor (ECF subfamily)